MFKRIPLVLICASAASLLPVYADDDGTQLKLIFAPGQTITKQAAAVKDSSLPDGYVAVEFEKYVQNGDFPLGHGVGDRNPTHWTLQPDGRLLYNIEYHAPVAPPPLPDIIGFETDVFNDPTLPADVVINFCALKSTLDSYVNTPLLKPIWMRLIQLQGTSPGWLSGTCSDGTPIIQRIESYATARNVPLK